MRLFLAYCLEDEILLKIENITQILKKEFSNAKELKLNYVDISSIHITIKFFENQKADKIINSLNSYKYNYSLIDKEFYLRGLDAFPNKKEPKVIILPIEDNNNLLLKNFEAVEAILEKSDIKKEDRKFKPHLTIARIKYQKYGYFDDFKYWNQLPGLNIEKLAFKGSKLKLFQSIITPEKPIYKELYEF